MKNKLVREIVNNTPKEIRDEVTKTANTKIMKFRKGWNHRVLAYQVDDEMYFEISEVHYNERGVANCHSDAASIGSENLKGLSWTLNRMKECLKKPILWGDHRFPQEYSSK